nr:hypothetical protein [Enterococcus durans]
MKKRLFMPMSLQFFLNQETVDLVMRDKKETYQLAHKRHRPQQKKKTILAKHFLVMK